MWYFAEPQEKQLRQEVENLTLTKQPLKTLRFFVLAVGQYINHSVTYLLAKGGWLLLLGTVVAAIGILIVTIDGPHGKVSGFVDYHCYFLILVASFLLACGVCAWITKCLQCYV